MSEKHFNTAVESAKRQHTADTASQGLLWAAERIQQLETEIQKCKENGYGWMASSNQFRCERDALVEAIQTHKDSIMVPEEDIAPEDKALWAALPKEKT